MSSISYVVTVYNKAACLPAMVQSLQSQVGDFESQYIFIDDGSTDDSLALLRELTKDLPNSLVVTQTNQGPSVAVNKGISLANNQYIHLIDADDKLLPDASMSLLELASNTGCQVVRGVHVNHYDRQVGTKQVTIIHDPLRSALRFMPIGGASTSLIETKLLKSVGGCDVRVFIQDYSLALRLSLYSDFAMIDQVVAHNIAGNQQRLSGNKKRENHDAALARMYFMLDHPELDYHDKIWGLSCHLRKCWSWHRKNNPNPYFSKHLWRYVITQLGLVKVPEELLYKWLKEGCEVFV